MRDMFSDLKCTVAQNYELKNITTLGVGGACKYCVTPDSLADLGEVYTRCLEEQLPVLIIGNGSNVLADDSGFDGVVIHVGKRLKNFKVVNDMVYAEAGVPLPKLAFSMAREGRSGFEFMAGIPGTVGGAVVMNAGCLGQETASVLRTVTYLDGRGIIQVKKVEELGLSFRSSLLQQTPGLILSASFITRQPEDPEEVMVKTKKAAEIRKGKFPINVATAGSTFKSPPEGPHPGRLIEEVGLKGYQIGGAQISKVHANWIINLGTATSNDVKQLMEVMQNTVAQKLGVMMEPEVLMV